MAEQITTGQLREFWKLEEKGIISRKLMDQWLKEASKRSKILEFEHLLNRARGVRINNRLLAATSSLIIARVSKDPTDVENAKKYAQELDKCESSPISEFLLGLTKAADLREAPQRYGSLDLNHQDELRHKLLEMTLADRTIGLQILYCVSSKIQYSNQVMNGFSEFNAIDLSKTEFLLIALRAIPIKNYGELTDDAKIFEGLENTLSWIAKSTLPRAHSIKVPLIKFPFWKSWAYCKIAETLAVSY